MITLKEWKERALGAEAELAKCQEELKRLKDIEFDYQMLEGQLADDEWQLPFPHSS